jgi:hypothetical protein
MSPNKRNIAVNVLFSNDKLLVGESDYYAKLSQGTTQIS